MICMIEKIIALQEELTVRMIGETNKEQNYTARSALYNLQESLIKMQKVHNKMQIYQTWLSEKKGI